MDDMLPCSRDAAVMHIAIAFLSSVTTVLTSWLALRARRIDKEKTNGNGHKTQP